MNYAKVTTWFLKVLSKLLNVPKAPLIEGENSILRIVNYCKMKNYNKMLIVTAPFMTENNLLNGLFQKLNSAGIQFCVFDKVDA